MIRTAISPRLATRTLENILRYTQKQALGGEPFSQVLGGGRDGVKVNSCELAIFLPSEEPRHPNATPKEAGDLTHIRKTPCFLSGNGEFREAAIPRPTTVRVSTGSMIPSSHRRAVL